MNRLIAALSAILVCGIAFGSEPPKAQTMQTVSITAKGADVRAVLHDVFTQTNHNYVLEPNVRFVIYLSVKDIEFEEALQIICKLASLDYQIQNGIYFVGPKKALLASGPTQPSVPKKPVGTLPRSILNKTVTTKLNKTGFKIVATALANQTGASIELDPAIANWKLDAFFSGSSLKYVLDSICTAGNLEYRFTKHLSIEIVRAKPKEENKVAIFHN